MGRQTNPVDSFQFAGEVRGVIERIRDIVQQWYLAEPALFGAWMTHELVENPGLQSIRVSRGKIEVNPAFIGGLEPSMLKEVLRFEAVRIILKHPYERKKSNAEAAWQASNLAIQESLRTPLPFPFSRDVFGTEEHDRKFYEFYYQLLLEKTDEAPGEEDEKNDESESEGEPEKPDAGSGQGGGEDRVSESGESGSPYFEPTQVAAENTDGWDEDSMLTEKIDEIIGEIEASGDWGTLPGTAQEQILVTLKPKLDYRRVLHAFRSSVISMRRSLTRMKPSRRYGFQFMGSRREFATRLLFAVDVSGSVSTEDISRAFSIVNRFFKYGIEGIDVIWFDTEIRSAEPLRLRKAARTVSVEGRGGTDFQPVFDLLDQKPNRAYDGLILFTDGIAPPPQRGKNSRTRVVWLFNHEENWQRMRERLAGPGMWSAFVRAD
ncbi:MAG: hypothetical protein HKN23_04620 [Verrucomicrobiales bacterium]|nr:hypothetical protein [Verrucomicrobiales bacterium]